MSEDSNAHERDRTRYEPFARELLAGGLVSDPWVDAAPRFSPEPELVSEGLYASLARAAEEVAEVYEELCGLVSDAPELLDEFFKLTPWQKAMWRASEGFWHGIARADVFVTDEGLSVAELNCDTPTGEAEAVELGRVLRDKFQGTRDPNAGLSARFAALTGLLAERLVDGPCPRTAGILYPTEFTEDLALVRCYRRWLEEAGWSVVLGSPYNLGRDSGGRLTLFDEPLGVLVRHYKTDWWGERSSAWDDEPIPDELPLVEPLRAALEASIERKTAVLNPFGAVLPQNKRSMAFMWEHVHRFSPRAQGIIERLVPYTSRLETLHPAQLTEAREQWVLKSDYGAEGDEVVVGAAVTQAVWEKSLAHARPGRWVAQRFFRARENARNEVVNYGVFLIAGECSGLYLRAQKGPTDDRALSVGALIAER